jgi:hypothetical protein
VGREGFVLMFVSWSRGVEYEVHLGRRLHFHSRKTIRGRSHSRCWRMGGSD